MAYPLDRPHFNSLERIAPSVVFDVPADIPTFLLDVAFFLPAFRTTLVSFFTCSLGIACLHAATLFSVPRSLPLIAPSNHTYRIARNRHSEQSSDDN